MNYLPLPLDMARGFHQHGMTCGLAIPLENGRANDQVCDSGFIFESYKDDARCGARPLPNENQARDLDNATCGSVIQFLRSNDLHAGKITPDEGDRMPFERQSNCLIVRSYLLPLRHRRQRYGRIAVLIILKERCWLRSLPHHGPKRGPP